MMKTMVPSVVVAVRKPSKTITRTYVQLDRGRFPANLRLVDKSAGIDLKHTSESLTEALTWMTAHGEHRRQSQANQRIRSKKNRQP